MIGSAGSSYDRAWSLLTLSVFAICSGIILVNFILVPGLIGSHAVLYTEAAQAWLGGGNPWDVGPAVNKFAGPPPMLLAFAPFAVLPTEVNRFGWVVATLLLGVWTIRALGLPGYWIAFPPILEPILLGHPEVLVLFLIASGGAIAGLAAALKPYAVFPLIAEHRVRALLVAAAFLLVTAPLLPWSQFIDNLPVIAETFERQSHGGSVFGSIPLMIIAVVALAALGLRRGLWLVTPILWPKAQPHYACASTPALSPWLAIAWSVPVPGFVLLGLVVEALATLVAKRRALPTWVAPGFVIAAPDSPLARPLSPWGSTFEPAVRRIWPKGAH